ncbi:MAG: DUF6268 family outer membrane beta-barrel protein [Verrucomicrobiota bacterium]
MKPFLFLPLALPLSLLASPLEEDQVEESFIPAYTVGQFYYSWNADADFDSGSDELGNQEIGLQANVPLFQYQALRATTGLRFRYNQFEFDGTTFPLGNQELDLYRVLFPFDFWTRFQENLTSWVRVMPGVATDFEDLNGDAFDLTVLALLSYGFAEDWKLIGGGYYSQDTGEAVLLPAVGLIWEPSPNSRLNLTFPRFQVLFAPNDDWLFSASAYLNGASWNVEDPVNGESVQLNYGVVRLALGAEKHLGNGFWLFGDIGYQVGQSLEIEDSSRVALDTDIDGNLFLNLGLNYRF